MLLVRKNTVDAGAIESLRAIAIFFLVTFHVIGVRGAGDGLNIGDGHALRIYADLLVDLRMPLFAFISGAVYALRPVQPDDLGRFLTGKFRRLAIPAIVSITIYAVCNVLVAHAVLPTPPWLIYVKSYSIYWYIQALLVIFATVCVVDVLTRGKLSWPIYVVASAALISGVSIPSTTMSLNDVTLLLPYFMMGVLFVRHQRWIIRNGGVILAWALVALVIGFAMDLRAFAEAGHFSMERLDLQSFLFASGFVAAGFLVVPPVKELGWLGRYSFTIYLYHILAVSACRRVLHAIGVTSIPTHMVLGTIVGIVLPILLHRLANRWSVTRVAMLGLRPRRTAAPAPAALQYAK